jgi:hypothetical protein
MAKAFNKAIARLERRRAAYEATATRQKRNNFHPNLSGGHHDVHRPGSMK